MNYSTEQNRKNVQGGSGFDPQTERTYDYGTHSNRNYEYTPSDHINGDLRETMVSEHSGWDTTPSTHQPQRAVVGGEDTTAVEREPFKDVRIGQDSSFKPGPDDMPRSRGGATGTGANWTSGTGRKADNLPGWADTHIPATNQKDTLENQPTYGAVNDVALDAGSGARTGAATSGTTGASTGAAAGAAGVGAATGATVGATAAAKMFNRSPDLRTTQADHPSALGSSTPHGTNEYNPSSASDSALAAGAGGAAGGVVGQGLGSQRQTGSNPFGSQTDQTPPTGVNPVQQHTGATALNDGRPAQQPLSGGSTQPDVVPDHQRLPGNKQHQLEERQRQQQQHMSDVPLNSSGAYPKTNVPTGTTATGAAVAGTTAPATGHVATQAYGAPQAFGGSQAFGGTQAFGGNHAVTHSAVVNPNAPTTVDPANRPVNLAAANQTAGTRRRSIQDYIKGGVEKMMGKSHTTQHDHQ